MVVFGFIEYMLIECQKYVFLSQASSYIRGYTLHTARLHEPLDPLMRLISCRPSHGHVAKQHLQRCGYDSPIHNAKIIGTALKVLALSGCNVSYTSYDNFFHYTYCYSLSIYS